MRFSQLPENLQEDICEYIHDTPNQYSLSLTNRDRLEAMTERELFDSFLCNNGIVGYTETIMDAYYHIFKKEEV